MKLGIVGLPNVGKSTLFNAITKAGALVANYPFATIDPNVGLVNVPDERLEALSKISNSKRILPAVVEFYDIAGLVKGASKGEGLGNKFLSNIRETDAIVEVLRCFDDPNVTHVDGSVDPLRDIETINLELILADLELVDKVLEKKRKVARADKSARAEVEVLEKIVEVLEAGKSARILELNDEEKKLLRSYQLLSTKPIIYVCNVNEDDAANDGEGNPYVEKVREFAKTENAEVSVVSAKIEQEISELDTEEEREEFLAMIGLEESGTDKVIKDSYNTLNLISFLTTGEMETRAWTITKGTKAVDAAGKIHTDISRGFIMADIISYEDLIEAGSVNHAKEMGKLRMEGKEYIMQDGDVVNFKFNV
ncbi:redox-regulated ATPase YchF [Anaerococcus sp. NML200574]|uniref:redox-regulated ATPase YchF n=1 Tax=unclassified Anaerococcus TaxID=2614126 RepID=UPI002237E190|nr:MULTISPECIES: redox-regulated ATPase YchF [unclassified Anaerococcus]MCW6677822.1 redox-regulated ATPase YchF [Anaerococcus sp. NML200574]MCW6702517.1 redox-regulated ATPase YchF [Anaerococcus sp. NML200537]